MAPELFKEFGAGDVAHELEHGAALAGVQQHAIDETAQQAGRLCPCRVVRECLVQACHPIPIDLGQVGVQQRSSCCSGVELALQAR